MASAKLTFGCSVAVDGYWDVAEMARRAEALGFERIAMGEHVMDGNPPRPPLMNIPAMAAAAKPAPISTPLTALIPIIAAARSESSLP